MGYQDTDLIERMKEYFRVNSDPGSQQKVWIKDPTETLALRNTIAAKIE